LVLQYISERRGVLLDPFLDQVAENGLLLVKERLRLPDHELHNFHNVGALLEKHLSSGDRIAAKLHRYFVEDAIDESLVAKAGALAVWNGALEFSAKVLVVALGVAAYLAKSTGSAGHVPRASATAPVAVPAWMRESVHSGRVSTMRTAWLMRWGRLGGRKDHRRPGHAKVWERRLQRIHVASATAAPTDRALVGQQNEDPAIAIHDFGARRIWPNELLGMQRQRPQLLGVEVLVGSK
jgi:hypothetical protein